MQKLTKGAVDVNGEKSGCPKTFVVSHLTNKDERGKMVE